MDNFRSDAFSCPKHLNENSIVADEFLKALVSVIKSTFFNFSLQPYVQVEPISPRLFQVNKINTRKMVCKLFVDA